PSARSTLASRFMNTGDFCAIATFTFSWPPSTGFAGFMGMTRPFDADTVSRPCAVAVTALDARRETRSRLCTARQTALRAAPRTSNEPAVRHRAGEPARTRRLLARSGVLGLRADGRRAFGAAHLPRAHERARHARPRVLRRRCRPAMREPRRGTDRARRRARHL